MWRMIGSWRFALQNCTLIKIWLSGLTWFKNVSAFEIFHFQASDLEFFLKHSAKWFIYRKLMYSNSQQLWRRYPVKTARTKPRPLKPRAHNPDQNRAYIKTAPISTALIITASSTTPIKAARGSKPRRSKTAPIITAPFSTIVLIAAYPYLYKIEIRELKNHVI